MVKYGKYLLENADPAWSSKYINYKGLKKLLAFTKRCKDQEDDAEARRAAAPQSPKSKRWRDRLVEKDQPSSSPPPSPLPRMKFTVPEKILGHFPNLRQLCGADEVELKEIASSSVAATSSDDLDCTESSTVIGEPVHATVDQLLEIFFILVDMEADKVNRFFKRTQAKLTQNVSQFANARASRSEPMECANRLDLSRIFKAARSNAYVR